VIRVTVQGAIDASMWIACKSTSGDRRVPLLVELGRMILYFSHAEMIARKNFRIVLL
jgi:hypothetical protein